MNIKRVFIIGAGPAGLACAYYLSKSKYDVKIFEQNEVVGGLARSWKWNGFNLDTGPHIFHTPVEEIKKDWEALFKTHLIKKDFYACNYRLNNYYDYPLNINQLEDFKISRSKFSDFLTCRQCFYLDRVRGLDPPGTPGWTLNETTDLLLKKEFDKCRIAQKPHRIFIKYGLNHLVPFLHKDMDKWRDSLRHGLSTRFKNTNIIYF